MRLYALLLGVLAVMAPACQVFASEAIGIAAAVRGTVTVSSGGETRSLTVKDPLYQNDTITTGANAQVQIIFTDETIFTIGRNSEVVLDTFVYDPTTRQGTSVINVTRGFFKFITGKIAKETPEKVKVTTPVATIGIRGSGGIGSVAPNGVTTIGLTVCCLDVTTPAGTVALNTPNFFTQVSDPNQPPAPPTRLSPQQLAALNAAVDGGGQDNATDGAPAQQGGGQQDGDGSGDGGGGQQQGGANDSGNSQGSGNTRGGGQREGSSGQRGGALQGGGTQQTAGSTRGGVGAPPPPAPPPAPIVTVDTTTAQQNQTVETNNTNSSTLLNTTPPPPTPSTHFGSYRLHYEFSAGVFDKELGHVNGYFRPSGGPLNLRLTNDADPNEVFFADLPRLTTLGQSFNATVDGRNFIGQGFFTPNHTFLYYDLFDPISGERLNVYTGTPLTKAQLPTNNPPPNSIPVFYAFLNQEMIDFGSSRGGFFNDFSSGTFTPAPEQGMVVDFNKNKHLSGFLAYSNTAGVVSTRLRVAFGDINRTAGDNAFLDGFGFGYDSQFMTGINNGLGEMSYTGVEAIGAFGNNTLTTSAPDAFVMEALGYQGNNLNNLTSNIHIDSANAAIRMNTPADAPTLFNGVTINSQTGFSAGHLWDYNNNSFGRYWSDDVSLVKTADTIAMSMTYSRFGGVGGPVSLTADFGASSSGENVILSDKAYAAELGNISGLGAPFDDFEGVAVSEFALGPLCGTNQHCAYSTWGVWAATMQNVGANPLVSELIPYITATTYSNYSALAGLGSVTYTGKAFGSVADGTNNTLKHGFGEMSMGVNFSTYQITSFGVTNFVGYQFSLDGGPVTVDNISSQGGFISLPIMGAGGISGTAKGLFVGPAGEEVMGQFQFTGTGDISGAGVFAGAR